MTEHRMVECHQTPGQDNHLLKPHAQQAGMRCVRMKALTVHPLEAVLISLGVKRIETRSWATNYRGLVAIHCSASVPRCNRNASESPAVKSILKTAGYAGWYNLPTGKVLAVVRISKVLSTNYLVACGSHPSMRSIERLFGDYSPNRYMWFLSDIQPLETPVSASGRLGLWDIEMEVPNVRE